jgi:hypothetical protein
MPPADGWNRPPANQVFVEVDEGRYHGAGALERLLARFMYTEAGRGEVNLTINAGGRALLGRTVEFQRWQALMLDGVCVDPSI